MIWYLELLHRYVVRLQHSHSFMCITRCHCVLALQKHQSLDLNQPQLSLQALAAQQMSQPTPARFYQNPRGRRPRTQQPPTPRNDTNTEVDPSLAGGGGPIRNGRNRKLWDHKYEAGRKEAGTRGHGTNFEEEQKLRFPESNPPFVTYAGFVDQLLRVLWEQGRGQVVFTLDAVAKARERVNGYKSRAGKSKVSLWARLLSCKCAKPTYTSVDTVVACLAP